MMGIIMTGMDVRLLASCNRRLVLRSVIMLRQTTFVEAVPLARTSTHSLALLTVDRRSAFARLGTGPLGCH